jgi:hypothetical protein
MGAAERRTPGSRRQVQYRLGNRMYSGDLVYRDGKPTLVISWRTVDWKRVPYISFPLDAAKLRPISDEEDVFTYEGELGLSGKTSPAQNNE